MSTLLDGRLAKNALELSHSPYKIVELYVANFVWNLFLTSTALHAIFLITSPIQAVWKWHQTKSSDSDTALPYICGFVGSAMWLRYSIFIDDTKLVLLQSYAVLMQIFFIFAMLFYRRKKRRLLRATFCVFTGIFLLFTFIQQLSHDHAMRFTGFCASGAQIAGSFVCPYLIYRAISSKMIDFVPFAPVAFTWIMELHAIIYSVGIRDLYLFVANTVFFCMDSCLLAVFFIYPTKKPGLPTTKHV